jgi:hypothetical protein
MLPASSVSRSGARDGIVGLTLSFADRISGTVSIDVKQPFAACVEAKERNTAKVTLRLLVVVPTTSEVVE